MSRSPGATQLGAVLLSGGAVAGTWTVESKPKATTIELSPWRRLAKGERATIEAEADAIGAFLAPGVDVRLNVNAPS